MLAAIPLLSLPVLVYNILVLTMAGGVRTSEAAQQLTAELFQIPMASGARLSVNLSDLVLAGALVILFIELLKSTTSQKAAIINHSLSMLLFVALPGGVPAVAGASPLPTFRRLKGMGTPGSPGRVYSHLWFGPPANSISSPRRFRAGLR